MFGQELVQYSSDFQFQDGVYLSFQDFENNRPIAPTYILSNLDIRSADYIEQVLELDTLTYYDGLFEEQKVLASQVWGFSRGGKVYIGFWDLEEKDDGKIEEGWYPLMFIGAYSYFTVVATVSRFIPPTPGPMMSARGTIRNDGYMYPEDGVAYDERVTVHQLLEAKTGNIVSIAQGEFNAIDLDLMQELLQKDPALLQEYHALSKREQKQKSMFYIRRFNDRNPIYFPFYETE